MQCLPASSLLFEVFHIRRGNGFTHDTKTTNSRDISSLIFFDVESQALDTLKFDEIEIYGTSTFFEVWSC